MKEIVRFDAGTGENCQKVEIIMNFWPILKAWRSDNWIAEAYVDGRLIASDLTADVRKNFRKWEIVFDIIFFTLLALGVLYWALR